MADFEEISKAYKSLFKQLFGKEVYNSLNAVKGHGIEYIGHDISSCEITAGFPNLKERFSLEGLKYFQEDDITMFELFLQSVFHLGQDSVYEAIKLEKMAKDAAIEESLESKLARLRLKDEQWLLDLFKDAE